MVRSDVGEHNPGRVLIGSNPCNCDLYCSIWQLDLLFSFAFANSRDLIHLEIKCFHSFLVSLCPPFYFI